MIDVAEGMDRREREKDEGKMGKDVKGGEKGRMWRGVRRERSGDRG